MKHLKKFNENIIPPMLAKGEIFVFPTDTGKDIPIKQISKLLGCEHDETHDYVGDYYLIKTPVGKEEEMGSLFVENYPEFFSSYERRDLRDESLQDKLDGVINRLRDMGDKYIGSTKNKYMKGWNEEIDSVIELLNKMKG